MRRFFAATPGWSAGAFACALLVAALARPASAAGPIEGPLPGSKNMNLTATAKYSASSEWETNMGTTTYVAAKSFDGDYTTRWNVDHGDESDGSWIAANWDNPVTVNKVVVYEAYDRLSGFRVQKIDPNATDWSDAFVAEGDTYNAVKGGDPANPKFTMRLPQAIQTKGIRILFTQVNSAPTIFEVEAYNNPISTVTGTVTDSVTAKPVQGAVITAGSDSTTSDAQGKYSLVTDAGTVNVSAGLSGYRTRIVRSVNLAANGTETQDIALIPTLPDLSLTATADASTEYSAATGYEANKANDGNSNTRWNSDSGDTDGSFLDLVWAQPQKFNAVVIHEAYDRIRNYSLQMWDSSSSKYVDIPGAANIDVSPRGGDASTRVYLANFLPAEVTSTKLRLLINHADNLPSVWELEVSDAPASAWGTFKGVVNDVASGKPVPNAVITDDQGEVLTEADANGAFSLPLETDDYVVTATAMGYFAGAAVPFTIKGGDTENETLTAAPQGPDIALTATASDSSEDPSGPASNVNDGDPTTFWLALDPTNQWVALTWKQPTTFTVVQLSNYQGTLQTSYLQMLETDGKTWDTLPGTTFAPEFSQPPAFFFPNGVTTTSLRFFITSGNSATNIPGLGEMYVYNAPIPKPTQ